MDETAAARGMGALGCWILAVLLATGACASLEQPHPASQPPAEPARPPSVEPPRAEPPDFRHLPGDLVLDLASDTDLRWLHFQLTGTRLLAPTVAERAAARAGCERAAGPGGRMIGLHGRSAVCAPAAETMVPDAQHHRLACEHGFNRRFDHVEGTRIVCVRRP